MNKVDREFVGHTLSIQKAYYEFIYIITNIPNKHCFHRVDYIFRMDYL